MTSAGYNSAPENLPVARSGAELTGNVRLTTRGKHLPTNRWDYGIARGRARSPTQRAKGCNQLTYRLALTLIASPRPRNVKSKEEPP